MARKGPKKPDPLCALLPSDPSELEADLAHLACEPSRAEPHLPAAPGSGSKRTLPPAPPPPLRGAVVDVPPAMRPLFSGGSGGRLLQRLLRQAVAELPTALALGRPHSGSETPPVNDGQKPWQTLVVGADIDFGTVPVSCLTAEQLGEAAAVAAGGLPREADGSGRISSGLGAAAAAGSLLDLLHLASSPQQQPAGSAAGGSQAHSSSTPLGDSAAAPEGPVLHFRQLVIENCSSGDELWLLGGVAAPVFPHTLAAVDDARLFWLDGRLPLWELRVACLAETHRMNLIA